VPIPLPNRCHKCGANLGNRKRKYCEACLPDAVRAASVKGVETQHQLHAMGEDGRSSQAAREKHRNDARRQARESQQWEARQRSIPSRATFVNDIAPLLQRVPSDVLVEATGLTRKFCNMVRRGVSTPHPRHWDALRHAARVYLETHREEPDFASDPQFFEREIAPHLRTIGAQAIQRATGLSHSYARRVLAGHHVPHARHWRALHDEVSKGKTQDAKK